MDASKFKLIEKIGGGGTAEVWLAEHADLKNRWAVKRIPAESPLLSESMREAGILKELNHPMLPRVADIFRSDEHVHIVMDLIEGITLREKLKQDGPLSIHEVMEIAHQLCGVLAYLHTRKPFPIIHRDIKPANLMLDESGNLKLIDFGSARAYRTEQTEDTVFIGTQGYAAPEQFGNSQSDARTDLYGMGIMLYVLLTGKNPADYSLEGLKKLILLRHVPKEFASFLEKCTMSMPAARYASAFDAQNDLRRILTRYEQSPIQRTISTIFRLREPDWRDDGRVVHTSGRVSATGTGNSGTVVIALSGSTGRIGTTHMAMSIGYWLSGFAGPVAVVSESDTSLSKVCESMSAMHDPEEVLRLGRLSILPRSGDVGLKAALCSGYAFLVVDLGTWCAASREFYNCAGIRIHLIGTKPWEETTEGPENALVLQSFSIPGPKSIPWSPDPLHPSQELIKMLNRVMPVNSETHFACGQSRSSTIKKPKGIAVGVKQSDEEDTVIYRMAVAGLNTLRTVVCILTPAAFAIYFVMRGLGMDPYPLFGDWASTALRTWIVSLRLWFLEIRG